MRRATFEEGEEEEEGSVKDIEGSRKDLWVLFQRAWIGAANAGTFINIPLFRPSTDETKPPGFLPRLADTVPQVVDLMTFEPLPFQKPRTARLDGMDRMRTPGTSFLPISNFEDPISRLFGIKMGRVGSITGEAVPKKKTIEAIVLLIRKGVRRMAFHFATRSETLSVESETRITIMSPQNDRHDQVVNFPQYTTLAVLMNQRAILLGKEMRRMNELGGNLAVEDMVLLVHNHLSRPQTMAALTRVRPGETEETVMDTIGRRRRCLIRFSDRENNVLVVSFLKVIEVNKENVYVLKHVAMWGSYPYSKGLGLTLYNLRRLRVKDIVLTDGSLLRNDFSFFRYFEDTHGADRPPVEGRLLTEEEEYRQTPLQNDLLSFEEVKESLSKQGEGEEDESCWEKWL